MTEARSNQIWRRPMKAWPDKYWAMANAPFQIWLLDRRDLINVANWIIHRMLHRVYLMLSSLTLSCRHRPVFSGRQMQQQEALPRLFMTRSERQCLYTLSAKGWISSYDLRGELKMTSQMDAVKTARVYLEAVSSVAEAWYQWRTSRTPNTVRALPVTRRISRIPTSSIQESHLSRSGLAYQESTSLSKEKVSITIQHIRMRPSR